MRTVSLNGLKFFALVAIVATAVASAQDSRTLFLPGNLVVSRTVYDNNPNVIQVGTMLPPNCQKTMGGCSGPTISDGTYPYVWNNDLVDGSFGITSKIVLDQPTPAGNLVNSLEVPSCSDGDHFVTSLSSKSELALNLSTDGKYVTFMGYVTGIDTIDASNSNTPGAVAQLDQHGNFHFTETNAYSGKNDRAAILNNTGGTDLLYAAGNAGNGGNPQPTVIIVGAGAQIMTPATGPEAD